MPNADWIIIGFFVALGGFVFLRLMASARGMAMLEAQRRNTQAQFAEQASTEPPEVE